jgi:O-antigen/teichoic acid export membrane protein
VTSSGENQGPVREELDVAEVRKRAFSGSAMLAVKGGVVQVLGLASTIVVAHYLTPGELGKVAFGITITTILAFIGGSQGLAGALIRRQEAPEPADLQAVIGLQLTIGVAIAFAVSVATWPLGEVGQLTTLMVWAIPITAFRIPAQTVLERSLTYRPIVAAEVSEVVLYQAWTIVTVLAGWGVWGLASAIPFRAVSGTTILILISRVRHLRPRFDRERSRRLLGVGLRIQATDLVDGLRDQGVNMAAASFGGLSVLGLWSMAGRALQLPVMLYSSLFRVSLPAMSRLLALGKDPKRLIEDAMALVAPGFGLILVPLAACSPVLFPAVLGERWAGTSSIMPPACLGWMVAAPIGVAGVGYLWAIGDAHVPLRGSILNTIAWFVVALPLLPILGAGALGLGMLAAYLVQSVTIALGVRKRVRIDFVRPVVVPLAIAVAAAAPVWLAASAADPSLLAVVVTAGLSEALYLGGLFLFQRRVALRLVGAVVRPITGRIRPGRATAAAGP